MLQHLDVSYNSFDNRSYYCPDEVFKELKSIQSLHIDAVVNVSFGKEFSRLHKLTNLKLTGLSARKTVHNDFFRHLPNLKFIDMSSQWDRNVSMFSGLKSIERGTFRRLPYLEVLDISYHRRIGLCGFTNVTHDLPFTSIKVLKAQYLGCERGGSTWLFNNDIKPLLNTKLQELYVDGNNLDKTELDATTFIPKSLRYLSATDNRWIVAKYAYFNTLHHLTNIKKIDLSFQNRHQMSQSLHSWQCVEPSSVAEISCLCKRFPYTENVNHLTFELNSLQSNLLTMSKNENKTNYFTTIHSCVPYFYPSFQLVIVPPNTEEIIVESARVGYSIPPVYISTSTVKKLNLRNNQIYSFTGPLCNFTNLQYLDLSGNRATDISSYIFGALSSLQHLALDNNILDSDRHFTKDKMVDYLEKQRDFRLCIHHRDFIAGCGIAENITNAIHNSRKFVCVLSEDFMLSEWCMYEFNIALTESTVSRQCQNMIIMLRLGRMDMKNIPTEIMYILKEDTYIEYPENENDRGMFWEDMAESLVS
ncbi:toll-like receptor 4 [Mytilus trossulus]|uniref:toll-like receptor 4 n=1 Tax=Mytilus trossulus TaxID=6551 RepID=UPI003007B4C2